MEEEAARAIFSCKDRYDLKKLLAKWKQQSPNARMKPDQLLLLHLSVLLIRIMNSLLILILLLWLNLILFMALNLKLLWHILPS